MKLLKCEKCGALIEIVEDCTCDDCGITCCNTKMKELKENSVDASFEKHLPVCEIKDDMVYVKVNHVMDSDHFINWIKVIKDNTEIKTTFNPGEEAAFSFKYVKGAEVYSYCNKHGLWKTVVE